MKFFSSLIKIAVTLPFAGFLLWLTLVNREVSFPVEWNPLNGSIANFSLPLVVFIGVVIGFLWGSFIFWTNTLPLRASYRRLIKQNALLENDLKQAELEKARLKKLAEKPATEVIAIDPMFENKLHISHG